MITYKQIEESIKPWINDKNLQVVHFHTDERFLPHLTIIAVPFSLNVVLLDLIIAVNELTIRHDEKLKLFYILLRDSDIECTDASHRVTIDFNQSEKSKKDQESRTRTGHVVVLGDDPVDFSSNIKISKDFTTLITKIDDTSNKVILATGSNTYASQKAYHTIERNIITTYIHYVLKKYNLKFNKGKILKY